MFNLVRFQPQSGFWFAPPVDPTVEVSENAEGLTLTADLPGVEEKDLRVHVVDGTLLLEGERKGSQRYAAFSRRFRLPETVDTAAIAADYARGVLTVRLPKREEARARQIAVKFN